jgi:hypothetical protein
MLFREYCNGQRKLKQFSRQDAKTAKCFYLAFLCALATLREISGVQTSPDEYTF